jgi:hypothetical protein
MIAIGATLDGTTGFKINGFSIHFPHVLCAGSVYLCHTEGWEWSQKAKLIAYDGQNGDWFGYSVAMNGNYIVSSATQDDSSSKVTNTGNDI